MIPSWIMIGALSGTIFGVADICTKNSLRHNHALVLLVATFVWAVAFWIPVSIYAAFTGDIRKYFDHLIQLPFAAYALIAAKGIALALSSFAAFSAIQALPITIAGALRASGPIWVLIGAFILFGEFPEGLQALGFVLSMVALMFYTVAGTREARGNIKILPMTLMIVAVLLAVSSIILDRQLIAVVKVDPRIVQVGSDISRLIAAIGIIVLFSRFSTTMAPLRNDHGVVVSGLLMSLGEFIYFQSVSDPDALLSVLSILRRISLLVAFPAGVILFGEKNIGLKALGLVFLIGSLALISLPSS